MLRSKSVVSLHEQRAMGKSIRQIARETGFSSNAVRNNLRIKGLPAQERQKRGSKLDPFKIRQSLDRKYRQL